MPRSKTDHGFSGRGLTALVLLPLLVLGCETRVSSEHSVLVEPLDGEGAAGGAPSEWQSHSMGYTNLVTPRWSPGGDLILARGTRGVGLYLLAAADGEVLYAEEGYHGDAIFDHDGSICRGTTEGATIITVDTESRQVTPTDIPCNVAVVDERLGERIHSGPRGEVYHNAYRGTVTLVSERGREEQIEDRGAWNVAVSNDGRRIAWSLGTLITPELFVYDAWTGVSSVGRGAHPTWSPDGRYLVYSVPDIEVRQAGGQSYRADLNIYDAEQDRVLPMSRTSEVAEMQPRFSPDGRRIVFADWDSGVITMAPFVSPGQEEGGHGR